MLMRLLFTPRLPKRSAYCGEREILCRSKAAHQSIIAGHDSGLKSPDQGVAGLRFDPHFQTEMRDKRGRQNCAPRHDSGDKPMKLRFVVSSPPLIDPPRHAFSERILASMQISSNRVRILSVDKQSCSVLGPRFG
jgi:hypothetical protein